MFKSPSYKILNSKKASTGSLYLTIERISDGTIFKVRISDHLSSLDRVPADLEVYASPNNLSSSLLDSIAEQLDKEKIPYSEIYRKQQEDTWKEYDEKKAKKRQYGINKRERLKKEYPIVVDNDDLQKIGKFDIHNAQKKYDFKSSGKYLLFKSEEDKNLILSKFFVKSNPRKSKMTKSRFKISKTLQKAVSNKIAKLIREGYSSDQAAAIAYKYARAHKLGPRGGLKHNPDEIKNLVDVVAHNGHTISVYELPSGKYACLIDDQDWEIDTSSKTLLGSVRKAKAEIDKHDQVKKNPRHELEREFSTALYMVSKKPSLINKIPENIRELFEKAGYVRHGEITSDGEKFLKFIKSRVATEAVNVMKNPDEFKNELVKINWLKEPITWSQFDEIHDYYNDKFVEGHVRWFDDKSGEGFVRLDEGPLKDASVFVHGSAFGGDPNFGQNTDFEATEKLPVKVKVWVDSNYLQIKKMKKV